MTILQEIRDLQEVRTVFYSELAHLINENAKIVFDKELNVFKMQEIVCAYYGISLKQMMSDTRLRKYCLPRQITMYFAKEKTRLSYAKIGEYAGGLDHSTAIYAVKTIKNIIETDKFFRREISEINHLINKQGYENKK